MRRLAAAAALSCLAACKEAGSPREPQATQPVPSTDAGATPGVHLDPPPPLPPNPAFLPEVVAPADNATTPEKVHLGHLLFRPVLGFFGLLADLPQEPLQLLKDMLATHRVEL